MFGYRVPAPDEAMLISGGLFRRRGAPFRVVTGHGAFVMPIFQKVVYLTLAVQKVEFAEQCVTKEGVTLLVRGVVAFKVGNDAESIIKAGQRFLSDRQQLPRLTRRIFAAHLRSIMGSMTFDLMTLEKVATEVQKLAIAAYDASKAEMASLGLSIDSLQIQSIDDMGAGHIAALAARYLADQQAAQAAQAQAQAQAQAAAAPEDSPPPADTGREEADPPA
jgi:flotillin